MQFFAIVLLLALAACADLHDAAKKNDGSQLKSLMEAGHSVDARDERKQATPLHWAARNGRTESVEALLAAGALVDARDQDESTPLHLASEWGRTESIKASEVYYR